MDKTQTDLSLTWDYQKFLINTWKSDNARPWKVYSADTFRRFWDVHVVEHRV